MLSPKPCPRNPLYLWRKGDVSRELWRTTCSILLHSGLIWITLWGQSQTLIYKKLMTTYALVLIYTHLRVSIKHHISTGHGGWIDLTLIKDVAVLRITWNMCRCFQHYQSSPSPLPVIIRGLLRHPGYKEVGTRPCPAPGKLSSQIVQNHDKMLSLPARSRRYNIMAVAPETNGQWVTSVWWPVITMGLMSRCPGRLISVGFRSLQILL